MKHFSKIVIATVMIISLLTLSACGGGSNGGSGEVKDTFVFGLSQELTDLDPHQETDAATRSILFNIFEGLVKATPDGDVTPAVAEDYAVSNDATVYTFNLRDGITFHDGNPVTAEDVKYSLERSREINGEASPLNAISDISIPDEDTIVITLDKGNSEFIYNLTCAILEKANDQDQQTAPVGTGPFSIVELREGEYLDLAKYDGYWNAEELGDYVSNVRVKFIASAQDAYVELQGHSIDALQYLTADQIDGLGDDYNIVEATMMLVHGMFINNQYEPLKDVRVRQALNYAVNRDEINQQLFGGKSPEIQTHGYPTITAWYNADTEGTYTYDPDKAMELLKEAGYENGFDLVITVPKNFTQHVDTAVLIKEQLAKVGINASVNEVEWNTWLSDVYQGRDYQATVIGFDISSLSPATWYVRYYSTSSNDMTNFSNAEYDAAYDQAVASIDHEEKFQLYGKLQQILAEEGASVFIEDPADFVAVSADFTGYTPYPVSAVDFSLIKPAQ